MPMLTLALRISETPILDQRPYLTFRPISADIFKLVVPQAEAMTGRVRTSYVGTPFRLPTILEPGRTLCSIPERCTPGFIRHHTHAGYAILEAPEDAYDAIAAIASSSSADDIHFQRDGQWYTFPSRHAISAAALPTSHLLYYIEPPPGYQAPTLSIDPDESYWLAVGGNYGTESKANKLGRYVSALKMTAEAADIITFLYSTAIENLTTPRSSYRYLTIEPGVLRHKEGTFFFFEISGQEAQQLTGRTCRQLRDHCFLWTTLGWTSMPSAIGSYAGQLGGTLPLRPALSTSAPAWMPPGVRVTGYTNPGHEDTDSSDRWITGNNLKVRRSQRHPNDNIWWWIKGNTEFATKSIRVELRREGCDWAKGKQMWYFVGDRLPDRLIRLLGLNPADVEALRTPPAPASAAPPQQAPPANPFDLDQPTPPSATPPAPAPTAPAPGTYQEGEYVAAAQLMYHTSGGGEQTRIAPGAGGKIEYIVSADSSGAYQYIVDFYLKTETTIATCTLVCRHDQLLRLAFQPGAQVYARSDLAKPETGEIASGTPGTIVDYLPGNSSHDHHYAVRFAGQRVYEVASNDLTDLQPDPRLTRRIGNSFGNLHSVRIPTPDLYNKPWDEPTTPTPTEPPDPIAPALPASSPPPAPPTLPADNPLLLIFGNGLRKSRRADGDIVLTGSTLVTARRTEHRSARSSSGELWIVDTNGASANDKDRIDKLLLRRSVQYALFARHFLIDDKLHMGYLDELAASLDFTDDPDLTPPTGSHANADPAPHPDTLPQHKPPLPAPAALDSSTAPPIIADSTGTATTDTQSLFAYKLGETVAAHYVAPILEGSQRWLIKPFEPGIIVDRISAPPAEPYYIVHFQSAPPGITKACTLAQLDSLVYQPGTDVWSTCPIQTPAGQATIAENTHGVIATYSGGDGTPSGQLYTVRFDDHANPHTVKRNLLRHSAPQPASSELPPEPGAALTPDPGSAEPPADPAPAAAPVSALEPSSAATDADKPPPMRLRTAAELLGNTEHSRNLLDAIQSSCSAALTPYQAPAPRPAGSPLPIPQHYVGQITGDVSADVHCYGYAIDKGICIWLNMGGPRTAVEAIRANLSLAKPVNLTPWDSPAVELTPGDKNKGMYVASYSNMSDRQFTSLMLFHKRLAEPLYAERSTTYILALDDQQAAAKLYQHIQALVPIAIYPEWTPYLWTAGRTAAFVRPILSAGGIQTYAVNLDSEDWTRLIAAAVAERILTFPASAA